LEALAAADYAHSLTLVNEALEQGVSWDVGKAEALNLRGTFKYIRVPLLSIRLLADYCLAGS
jgi:import receptor subunit TOM70